MKSMRAMLLCTCALAALGLPYSIAMAGNIFTVVSGTKTASGNLIASGNVTYTVVLSNTGNGAQADNPGNEFTDVLPAGLTLISATATSGTALATVASNTATWNGSIAAGGSAVTTTSDDVTGADDDQVIVWGSSDDEVIVWGSSDDDDVIVWGSDCPTCEETIWSN